MSTSSLNPETKKSSIDSDGEESLQHDPMHIKTQNQKRELRKKMNSILNSISDAEIEQQGSIVRSKLMKSRIYKESNSICAFISFRGEIDTFPILRDVLQSSSSSSSCDGNDEKGDATENDTSPLECPPSSFPSWKDEKGKKKLYIPFLEDQKSSRMTFLRIYSMKDLELNFEKNKWGILEPKPESIPFRENGL